ncbi:M3 family oligoendopeptidase [Salinispira pacifica]
MPAGPTKKGPRAASAARRAGGKKYAGGGKNAGSPPRWDLAPIYPSFDSDEYRKDRKKLQSNTAKLLKLSQNSALMASKPEKWLADCIKLFNSVYDLTENLQAYAYLQYSVNTQDRAALQELNSLEEALLPLHRAQVHFRTALDSIRSELPAILERDAGLGKYRYFLDLEIAQQDRQMTAAEEDLAADLLRPGGDAWSRLQEAVSSNMSVVWNEKSGERKSVVQLRGLAYDADRSVRQKAYELELSAWSQAEIPLSYALNGVKGFSAILNRRRRYQSTLDRSIFQARINRKILNALTSVMEESLPVFRKYLRAKAKLLGLRKLAFYDIFAPVGSSSRRWSFADAERFIVEKFGEFSPEMGEFAAGAFRNRWIDAEPRKGKVGGAYCQSFPLARASRILSNFEGSFSDVSTLAHELGHAYHHEVLKDASAIHRSYPMTLAETASIFSETIVYNSALATAPEAERITILETFLQNATQVIVDILSRFKFENRVMELRPSRELGPDELCEFMLQAQRDTYGNALDSKLLHPYMWAVKGHYYSPHLGYYNFPYAFGQLFGLGLYRLYEEERDRFAERYRTLLLMTGQASAAEVTKAAGFNIEKPDFWRTGIAFIEEKVNDFAAMAASLKR